MDSSNVNISAIKVLLLEAAILAIGDGVPEDVRTKVWEAFSVVDQLLGDNLDEDALDLRKVVLS